MAVLKGRSLVFFQYPVGNFSMGDQFDGAIVGLQLFFTDPVGVMIVQRPVDAGDGFYIGADGAQVVGNHYDRQGFVELF